MNRLIRTIKEWEYWPSFMFYVPNIPYALYLMLKARNNTFYAAVNPTIKSSGNGTESKYNTLALIPDAYKPESVFVKKGASLDHVLRLLEHHAIHYPFIAKPDVGFRGMLVEKIHSQEELQSYIETYPIDIILQEFIQLPQECGLFYYRIPSASKGSIPSLTFKSFLRVTGDGVSPLSDLVRRDKRAQHYIPMLRKKHRARWHMIPGKEEVVLLSEIGNHIRGTEFINANDRINEVLVNTFDAFSRHIDGWYYGRLDIKYNSWEELLAGKFIVLEINGIISEPTHIYDPHNNSYFKALKTFRKHWDIMYDIAQVNMKNGVKTKSFYVFYKEIIALKKYIKTLQSLAKKAR